MTAPAEAAAATGEPYTSSSPYDARHETEFSRYQPRPRTADNSKLEELKRDFCLLAEKLQGSSQSSSKPEGSSSPRLPVPTSLTSNMCDTPSPPPTVHQDSNSRNRDVNSRVNDDSFDRNPRTSKCKSHGIGQALSGSYYPAEESLERIRQTQKCSAVSVNDARASLSVRRGTNKGAEAPALHHDGDDDLDAHNLKRIRAAAYEEGRHAAEAAARFAKQAVKSLSADLEDERRRRVAAER
ncbi:unnamed protein product [Sphacelaria rigidula]